MNYLLPVVLTTLLLSAFMKNVLFAELRARAGNGRSGRRNGME